MGARVSQMGYLPGVGESPAGLTYNPAPGTFSVMPDRPSLSTGQKVAPYLQAAAGPSDFIPVIGPAIAGILGLTGSIISGKGAGRQEARNRALQSQQFQQNYALQKGQIDEERRRRAERLANVAQVAGAMRV